MRRFAFLLALPLALGACSSDDKSSPKPEPEPTNTPTCEDVPTVETLRWKRVDAFIADLGRALELEGDNLCMELGLLSCENLYRLPLGGSDPFGAAIYDPPGAPMNTTSVLAERVTLAACANRVALDQGNSPVVFKHVDLTATSLTSSSEGVAAQVDELYRRLLSRDPTDDERTVVASLADGNSGADFAKLACFTIGTTTEFLFF
jgi:hypothetical protein